MQEAQFVTRFFNVNVDGLEIVVPLTCRCFYDHDNTFVVQPPNVDKNRIRYGTYRFESVSEEVANRAIESAIAVSRDYDWRAAHQWDTMPA